MMRQPSKALIDRLTLEVIAAAGANLDVNLVITLALKIGYRAGVSPQPSAPIDSRLASTMRTLRRSGLSVAQIAARYDMDADDVRAALRGKG